MDKKIIVASLLAIADKLDEQESTDLIQYSNALTKIAKDIIDNYDTLDGFVNSYNSESDLPLDGPIDLGTDAGNDLGLDLGSEEGIDLNEDINIPSEEILPTVASVRLKKKIRS